MKRSFLLELLSGDILVARTSPDQFRGFWAVIERNGTEIPYWLELRDVDVLPSEPSTTTDQE